MPALAHYRPEAPLRIPASFLWIVSTLLFSLNGTASAQEPKMIGVLAGVDNSSLSGGGTYGSTNRTGFMGGIFLGIQVSESWILEPEALYAMKGAGWENGPLHGMLALDYLEIPVVARYRLNAGSGIYFLAGPTLGFNVACQESYDTYNAPPLPGATSTKAAVSGYDVSQACSDGAFRPKNTIGGVVGAGFKRGVVGFEARFELDFSNAVGTADGADVNAKNRVLAALVRIGT
ncbi:MAG: porin family protein [Gemmatimonadales bacterium]